MPLPDRTTQALGHDAFSVFEDLSLLGNGERTQSLQLENLHKTSTIELIESALTSFYQPFRKVRLSSPLPTRNLMPTVVFESLPYSQHSELLP